MAAAFFASIFRRGGGDRRLLFVSPQQQSWRFSPSLRGASSSLSNDDEGFQQKKKKKTGAGRLQSLVIAHHYLTPGTSPSDRKVPTASSRHRRATDHNSLCLPCKFVGIGFDEDEELWKGRDVRGFYLAERPFVLVADERDVVRNFHWIFEIELLEQLYFRLIELAMRLPDPLSLIVLGSMLHGGPFNFQPFRTRCHYKARLFWQKCRIDAAYGPGVFGGGIVDGYSRFNSDVFFTAVRVILSKLKSNDGESLVRQNLITRSALKTIEKNLRKLTNDQRSLLDIGREDFVHSDVPIVDMSTRREGQDTFLDILLYNVAIYRSQLIDRSEEDAADEDENVEYVLSPSYPFKMPPLLYVNVVFSRRIRPSVASDFVVSQFNVIAVCYEQQSERHTPNDRLTQQSGRRKKPPTRGRRNRP